MMHVKIFEIYGVWLLQIFMYSGGNEGQEHNILAHLLKARTVEVEKQPLLVNVRTQQLRKCYDT